jgi:hypothetical protein
VSVCEFARDNGSKQPAMLDASGARKKKSASFVRRPLKPIAQAEHVIATQKLKNIL